MFSNKSTSIKLHLIIILCSVGVAYFMYQLYNECKQLERELIVSKREIAILTSKNNNTETIFSEDTNEIIIIQSDKEDASCDIDTGKCENASKDDDKYIEKVIKNIQSSADTDSDSEGEEEMESEDNINDKKEEVIDESESESEDESESDEERDVKEVESQYESIDSNKNDIKDDQIFIDYSKMSKNALMKIKISTLKDYLVSVKINSSGTKNEVVNRILSI